MQGKWDMLKEKKRKKKKARVIRSCEKSWSKRAIFDNFCVSSRENKTQRKRELHLEWCNPNKEIERNTVRVREWKRKRRYFSLLKLHTRKINWWSFYGVFECYNHGELEYSKEDFATSFVVRLYLLLKIYLLYIQFIVDSSLA